MSATNFDRIFRNYYQKERQRSEDCIGSIISTLTTDTPSDAEKLAEITDTIIRHYDRK